ncbi:MAG: SigE family RNA polymerase sigma factor [Pseudonocardiales bacterium]|nr:MAG: SigE family RNA polymerase sigma factor [Pseudonocardiales bacterium]
MEFDEFVRTELRQLLHFTRALTGDRGLAEDIVQETLIRLHARGDQLVAIDNISAYARRMAVNEYVSWGRKWFRIRPTAVLDEPTPQADHAEEHADRDFVRKQLGRLPRRQRAVLTLRYYSGLTDAEIADELGCSAGTVRSHASRALAALRIELTEQPLTTQETWA